MRAFVVTAVYTLGLLGLLAAGLAAGMRSDDVDWISIAGLTLLAASGSAMAGFLARHLVVLVPPLCLAGLLLVLTVAMLSGGAGDGGPAAVAAVLLPAIAILMVLAGPAGLGVVLSRWLRRPAPRTATDRH